jgi:hypothetical protein
VGISRFFMWDMFKCSETQCSKPLAGGGHSRIGGGGAPKGTWPTPCGYGAPRVGGAGHQSEILITKVATMSSSGTEIGKVVARSSHMVGVARQVR